MPRYSESQLTAIKNAVSIVEYARETLPSPVERSGSKYKTLCPFHDDHTPSLTLDPERQSFKCWSCGAGGDIYSFVKDYERVDFSEAVRMLADRAGIVLESPSAGSVAVKGPSKSDLFAVCEWAEAVFRKGHVSHGFIGVQYRELTPELARQFKLENTRGLLIQAVEPNSPAAKAGLERGDVVVKLGDKELAAAGDLRGQVERLEAGAEVPLEFYRGGKRQTVQITIAERPSQAPLEPIGFSLFQIPPGRAGNPIGALIIERVVQGSAADKAGLRPGMKIIGVGSIRVHTKAEYIAAIAKQDPARKIPFEIQLGNGEIKSVDVGGPADNAR